jgi:LysM repeat protein
MKKLRFIFLLFTLLSFKNTFAQQDPVVIEYINTYKELAINEMQRTGIPASIKLAQGIHETSAGQSDLVRRSNNHFGLKCKTEWTGMSVKHTDDAPNECFRKYVSPDDSYKDQSDYLKKSPRYAPLFNLDPTDYKAWAFGLKKAGYATNPKYSQVIIKLIEDYNLQDYTMIAMGKMKKGDDALAKSEKIKDKTSDIIISNGKPVVMPPEPEIVVYASKKDAKKQTETQVQQATVETKIDYPDGEFKINETKVVYIKKGTSFLSIAEKYSVPLARIFEFNEMKVQETAEKDQLIYIMRKRKTGLNEQHVVKPGETVADIAQAEALRIESLMEYNFLQPGMKPAIGSVLYLRTKGPAQPALASGK